MRVGVGGVIVDPEERKVRVAETLCNIHQDSFFESVQVKLDLKYRPSRVDQREFLKSLVGDILDMTAHDAVMFVEKQAEAWMRAKNKEVEDGSGTPA